MMTKVLTFTIVLVLLVTANVAFAQQPANRPIAILGIPEETEELLQQLTDIREVNIQGLSFSEGSLRGRRVVLGRVGFGKTNAALAATLMIEHFKPEALIFTGSAGALNPELVPGDIVIGTHTTQHDFGIISDKSPDSPTGFTHWRTRNPITNEKNPLYFTANDRLLRAARAAGSIVKLEKPVVDQEFRDPKVFEGVVATGDLFVSEKSKNYELSTYFDADAVEMEGAAVAQISWQFKVPCIIIRSISDTASWSALDLYYQIVKVAARNSSALVAETVAQLSKLPAQLESCETGMHGWTIAFELAFGKATPYSEEFPDLYQLSYETNLAITKEVLAQIVSLALKETQVTKVALNYRPGGYKEFPVVPSAQLEVSASEAKARDVMSIVGYLAQQTLVVGSCRAQQGNRNALLILESSGTNLSSTRTVQEFWHRLSESSPKLLPGFSGIEVSLKAGLYIIDSDGDWVTKDWSKFKLNVARLSREFGISTEATMVSVNYSEVGNNWKLDKKGEQYLRRFAQSDVRRRLESEYQPLIDKLIRKAFEKYAPELLRQSKGSDKKSERPRLNTPTIRIEKQGRPEYMQTP